MPDMKKAFVLMPFSEPINSYYSDIFRPALEDAGYEAMRADDLFTPRPIMLDIQESIVNADLILCEMSNRNANVFYELGLAHAIGKPVILVSRKEEDIPFDLRHVRIITYDNADARWADKLRDNIQKAAKAVEESEDGEIWPPPLITQVNLATEEDDARQQLDRIGIPYTQSSFFERARLGDDKAISLFLQAGMPPDIRDMDGITPLGRAVLGKHTETARTLMKAGANPNVTDDYGDPYILTLAAESGHVEIMPDLLERGADVNQKIDKGEAPLVVAIRYGDIEAVNFLIEHGANIEAKNQSGESLLFMLVGGDVEDDYFEENSTKLLRLLVGSGIDVNERDKSGNTALMTAIDQGYYDVSIDMINALIEAGADVNAKSDIGEPVLLRAISTLYDNDALWPVVGALVKAGADVNATNDRGESPLFALIGEGDVDSIDAYKTLIEAGANVKEVDEDGTTTLMAAVTHIYDDDSPLPKLLIDAGADVNHKNEQGESALTIAKESELPKIEQLLRDSGAKE